MRTTIGGIPSDSLFEVIIILGVFIEGLKSAMFSCV